MTSPPEPPAPLRLTDADFDAYLPERATSNAFTAPRLALKQRMLAWSRGVVARLGEVGIGVEVSGSDEHPSLRNGRRVDCQRVFFWRDASARAEIEQLVDRKRSLAATLNDPAPHQRHAYLAIRLDATKLEMSFELHPDAWVDLRNARARLADPGLTLELTSAFEALPEQFTMGLASDVERSPAPRATSDAIRALLDRAEQEQRALWVGWTIPRDVAVPNSEVLDDQLEDAIVALGPILKLVAWSTENDLFDLAREAVAARPDRARADDEPRRAARHHEPKRDRSEQGEQSEKEGRVTREHASVAPPRDTTPSAEPPPARPSRPPPMPPRMMMRRGGGATEVDPSAPIEKGTRVQVLAGPFRGKTGVVQELDGKGGARVMLGLLAARVEVKDLIAAAEGKDRPALASSHRKPMGARS